MGEVADPAAPAGPGRLAFLDALRIGATLLVVLHHAAITYGAAGGWYWHARPSGSNTLLTLFVTMNQAWFMGFFFLVAGYFTPAAFDRKGAGGFITGRLLRLGVPTLVFAMLLDPLTSALARWRDVPGGWERRVLHGEFHLGPMWFAEALLGFSLIYVAWRRAGRRGEAWGPPGNGALAVAALAVGVAAFGIRLWAPTDRTIGDMLPGYFAGYAMLFAAGVSGARGAWLERVRGTQAASWAVVSMLATVGLVASVGLTGSGSYSGGWSLRALIYAFYEPFFAWGVILALLWAGKRAWPAASIVRRWLGRRAFSVYVLHPPVLVTVARLLQPWEAGPVIKTVAAGGLAFGLCLGLGSALVAVPGVRRVL